MARIDGLNDELLDPDSLQKHGGLEDTTPVLTFSHFLSRIELIPEKRYLVLPTLHSCIGSTFLEARLRRLRKVSAGWSGDDDAADYDNNGDDHQNGNESGTTKTSSSSLSSTDHDVADSNHFHAFGQCRILTGRRRGRGNQDTISTKIANSIMQNYASSNKNKFSKLW